MLGGRGDHERLVTRDSRLQIDRRLHERAGKAITNFALTMPREDSDLAQQAFKDPYVFDFLVLTGRVRERELETGLIDHVREFLLELLRIPQVPVGVITQRPEHTDGDPMTIASPLATDELATMLRAGVRGDVVTPDDASFPAAAFGLDLSAAHRPDLVVIAANSGDAAATVRLAARAGRRVVVQATGHRPAQAGPGTVLIVTRLLAQVRIDPEAKTAIVGAGASWRQVLEAAEPYGLAPISSSADREPLARTFAFAVDHIRELEVVTARGDVLTVDAHRDMFHALRRGRAPFGLVTAATIDLVPLARLYAGGLWFPAGGAADFRAVLPRTFGGMSFAPGGADLLRSPTPPAKMTGCGPIR